MSMAQLFPPLDRCPQTLKTPNKMMVPMGSIVRRSVPTNLKLFPNCCSHAHALSQDRSKDVRVGSKWFSTLYTLSPNFHILGLRVFASYLLGTACTRLVFVTLNFRIRWSREEVIQRCNHQDWIFTSTGHSLPVEVWNHQEATWSVSSQDAPGTSRPVAGTQRPGDVWDRSII